MPKHKRQSKRLVIGTGDGAAASYGLPPRLSAFRRRCLLTAKIGRIQAGKDEEASGWRTSSNSTMTNSGAHNVLDKGYDFIPIPQIIVKLF
jgi:hypothetical protein